MATHLVRARVGSWLDRRQLSPEEHSLLTSHVGSDEASVYVTDFGIHIAIKVPVKVTE